MNRYSATRQRLKRLWRDIQVESLADGTIRITPQWRDEFPGVITRMYAARLIKELIVGNNPAPAKPKEP